ncbi:MAG: hypothetical protein Q9177_001871 [Variospora cf. flavescens]
MSGMTPSQYLYQKEHILDNRYADVVGTAVSMAIVATAAVTIRFECRRRMKVAIAWDDWLMLASLIFSLGLCFILGYGTNFGTGRHLLAIGDGNVQKYLQLTYAFQIIYGFALVTARLSILYFYHRLFPRESAPRWWRACLYVVTFFVIGWFIAGLCCVTFICTPISYYWTRTGNGHCINEMAVMYLSAALTIVADILILLLPLPVIWNLHMRRSKKIGVMTIFLLGGFTCVATIVRFCYVPKIVLVDPTWTQVDPGLWSTIEPCLGIVSACLPIIGSLLRSKLGSSVSNSSGPGGGSGSKSWFSRSNNKRSSQGAVSYGLDSSDRRKDSGPLSNSKKPDMTATVYSKNTQSDEEMALPLRDIQETGQ